MITYAEQFAILLSAYPSDDDFIKKVKQPRVDLDKAFQMESMKLSHAILTLLGFLPGDWLDQIPSDPDVFFKLQHERGVYQSAKEAIRARKLKAHLEGEIYYIRPMDLVRWFRKKGIWIHDIIADYLTIKDKPKKRGCPMSCPDILQTIADVFKKKSISKILVSDLKILDEELIETYLAKRKGMSSRRLKTLLTNVNKLLANQ